MGLEGWRERGGEGGRENGRRRQAELVMEEDTHNNLNNT